MTLVRKERIKVRGAINLEGRVPPHNLNAEAAVLSACMIDRSAFDALEGKLAPEQFYSEAHGLIFDAIAWLCERGTPCDIVQVAERLNNIGRIAQIGGTAYLTSIINETPAVANAASHAAIIREKWRLRELSAMCLHSAAQCYLNDDPSSVIGELDGELIALAGDDHGTDLVRIGTVVDSVLKTTRKMADSGKTTTGHQTGFTRYDNLTSGLHDGDLTIVAARPGMGKTSLVLNMAVNVSATENEEKEHDLMSLIFSLEMPREQLANRMVCSEARVDSWKSRSPRYLNQGDWQRLIAAEGFLKNLPILIDDTSGLSLSALRTKVRSAKLEWERPNGDGERKRRIALVVVDYLQLMKGRDGVQSREQEISEISRGLKGLAKEFKVPVIALSQINRAVESRAGKKRPQISDLRESGAIEQDADNICFIYRDDYYDKKTTDQKIAELIVAKQRNGPTATVKVRFDSEYTRFDNLADADYPEDNQ